MQIQVHGHGAGPNQRSTGPINTSLSRTNSPTSCFHGIITGFQKYKAVLSLSLVYLFGFSGQKMPLIKQNKPRKSMFAWARAICWHMVRVRQCASAYVGCMPACTQVCKLSWFPLVKTDGVFCVLLHTLPLTLQGGSITARNKHPVFGSQAQEVNVYCYWAGVSYWITWGRHRPKWGMWA